MHSLFCLHFLLYVFDDNIRRKKLLTIDNNRTLLRDQTCLLLYYTRLSRKQIYRYRIITRRLHEYVAYNIVRCCKPVKYVWIIFIKKEKYNLKLRIGTI